MAGYREHISVSGLLGIAYGFAAIFLFGYSGVQAAIAAVLTWIAGMLPDLDSETGRPVRELFGITSALAPVLVLQNVNALGVSGDRAMLFSLMAFAAVKYGGAFMLAKMTVHRGMFHSIPALLIASEVTFLCYHSYDLRVRLLMAIGVGIGYLSHLVLDEMYSVQWDGTRVRLKNSAGTAMKFFGRRAVPNGITLALLLLFTYMSLVHAGIVREPGTIPAPETIYVTSDLEDAPLFRVASDERNSHVH